MSSANTYVAVLLEEVRDQYKTVLEAVGGMQKNVALIPEMREDISEMKQDIKVLKAALTDTNHQVQDHEVRISRLETV